MQYNVINAVYLIDFALLAKREVLRLPIISTQTAGHQVMANLFNQDPTLRWEFFLANQCQEFSGTHQSLFITTPFTGL